MRKLECEVVRLKAILRSFEVDPGAESTTGRRKEIFRSKGYINAPGTHADVPVPTEVEVIDQTHPLYRQRFRIVSVVRQGCGTGQVRIEWRFGLTLLLPLSATDIETPEELRITSTRLSIEALEDLVAVAEGSEGVCPSSLEKSGAHCRRQSAMKLSKTSQRRSQR